MKRVLSMLVVLSLFSFATGAGAAAIYKINNTDNLNTVTSWSTTSGAQTPNPGSLGTDTWYFNDVTMLGSKTVSLGADRTIVGIGMDNTTSTSPGNTYNVVINSGNTLTLNGGTISGTGVDGGSGYTTAGIVLNRSVGGTLTINCDVALGAAQQWVTSRALAVGGAINLSSYTLSLNTAGSSVQTFSGVISGTGALNKSAGTGTLTLSNTANTFGGQVTLVGGTTRVVKLADSGSNSSLGTGSVASSIIINGATLTMDATGSGGSTNRAIDMRAGATINNDSSSTISFTAANVIQGGTASARTLTLGGTNTGDNTFSSILGNSGTGANISRLQKSDAGKWIITGTQTYTGATVINRGTLYVGGSSVLGGATGSTGDESNIWFTSSNTNGALHFETAANLGAADQIRFRNTGGTVGSGGNLKYVGTTAQTVSKTLQCDSSIGIRLESDSVGGSIKYNGAFSQTDRGLYLGGTGTGDNELAMSFAGAGAITKRDAGKWILSVANSHTGGVALSGGILGLGNKAAMGSGTLNVSGASTLLATTDLTGANKVANAVTVGANFTVGGSQNIELGGNVTSSGSNSRTLTVSNSATTTLSGNLYLAENDTNTGRVLELNGAGATVISGNIHNNAAGNTVAAGLRINNAAAVVTLSGSNDYTGVTTLSAGTIRVNSNTAFGSSSSVAINGVTLDNTSGGTRTLSNAAYTLGANNIYTGTGGAVLDLGTGTMSLNGSNRAWQVAGGELIIGGVISGSAGNGLTKTGGGTLTLSASSTYTGATSVNNGTLAITGTGALTGTTSVSVASGATLNNNGTVAGTVTVAAGGILSGSGTVTGLTEIGGTHRPGNSPGLDTYTAGLTYDAGSTLEWEFSGDALTTRGTDYDAINVTGGNLTLTNLATFKIINYVGTAVDYTAAAWDNNRSFNVISLTGGGNMNGTLFTLDDTTNAPLDQGSWSLVATAGGLDVKWTAIPEPATFSLLGAAALAAIWRRRKIG